MTDNEKLDLILAELKDQKQHISGIETELRDQNQRISGIETELRDQNQRISGIEQHVAGMETELRDQNQRISGIEQHVAGMEDGMAEQNRRIGNIELTLENEISQNIKIVAEGHRDLYRKLDDALKVGNEREMLLIRMNIFETELRSVKERMGRIEAGQRAV